MTANANIVSPAKGTSTLVRPRFSPGLLLRDDDLKAGVDYTRDLSRLLFRSLFGCGVVCGLKVEAAEKCGKLVVTVRPGVALNGKGDPIHVPQDKELIIDPTCGEKTPSEMWVILCHTTKCCAPRSTVCGCEEEDSASVCTREQVGFEILLTKDAPDSCDCPCPKGDPAKSNSKAVQESTKATKDGGMDGAQPAGCACVDPCDPCYREHYAGICGCDSCGKCVVLAYLAIADGEAPTVDHSVRRFVRPVLMRDPIAWIEKNGGELCPPLTDPANAKSRKNK